MTKSKKTKKRGGENIYYGFAWDRQSCWIDSSLMALFYPTQIYSVMNPYVEKASSTKRLTKIVNVLKSSIQEIRTPNISPSLHGLRRLFANQFASSNSAPRVQKDAFQLENELGYVFYFIQELLHIMGVPPIVMYNNIDDSQQSQWILEVEHCNETTLLESCLEQNYKNWYIEPESMTYLFIELISNTVKPQEYIRFNDINWELTSMIVFDCSHFISYLKKNNSWYLYDDTRSLSHHGLMPYTFGNFYSKGFCNFQYGKQNTFFFYIPK